VTAPVAVSHSGDFGDTLYHLPCMRDRWGRVDLTLFPAACTGHRMTRQRCDVLGPLLRMQPYIASCEWNGRPKGFNFDRWRQHYRPWLNLTDMACEWLGVPHPDRETPWLVVDDVHRLAEVVFARSPRYHNPEFPWRRVWETYRRAAIFVGLPEEHEQFCAAVGDVPFVPTRDYLELARIIAGCALFVGNQSSPRAVAEGLKVPVLVEVDKSVENTHWGRATARYGYGPEIEGLTLAAESNEALPA